MGPGKLTARISANINRLHVRISAFPLEPAGGVGVGVVVEESRKSVDVSGNTSRWFTLTQAVFALAKVAAKTSVILPTFLLALATPCK
jgi:hypothetical protein